MHKASRLPHQAEPSSTGLCRLACLATQLKRPVDLPMPLYSRLKRRGFTASGDYMRTLFQGLAGDVEKSNPDDIDQAMNQDRRRNPFC
jgi:hypothetical protein